MGNICSSCFSSYHYYCNKDLFTYSNYSTKISHFPPSTMATTSKNLSHVFIWFLHFLMWFAIFSMVWISGVKHWTFSICLQHIYVILHCSFFHLFALSHCLNRLNKKWCNEWNERIVILFKNFKTKYTEVKNKYK